MLCFVLKWPDPLSTESALCNRRRSHLSQKSDLVLCLEGKINLSLRLRKSSSSFIRHCDLTTFCFCSWGIYCSCLKFSSVRCTARICGGILPYLFLVGVFDSICSSFHRCSETFSFWAFLRSIYTTPASQPAGRPLFLWALFRSKVLNRATEGLSQHTDSLLPNPQSKISLCSRLPAAAPLFFFELCVFSLAVKTSPS